jgi:nuclear pore complex protein Nup155
MHSIKGLLIHMGKIYSQNERYFPLVYLIKLLEQHGCELGWKPGFIPEVFQLLGVSYSTLFSHYNNLFVEKDSIWTSIGHPLHILSVQLTLLNDYMKIASSYEMLVYQVIIYSNDNVLQIVN